MGLGQQASADPRPADVPLAAVPAGGLPDAPEAPTVGLPAPSASVATPGAPSASASASPGTTVKPKPSVTTTSAGSTKKTETAKVAARSTDQSILGQVLAHINAARADEGLSALTLDADLSKASALHNALMIDGCGLSHQCSGEGDIGKRFSAQGVDWSSAGENIGYGSSGGGVAAMVKAANGLTDSMLAEKAPDDGHRKNLLSTSFTRIGLSITRDSKGITWMTQDFVG
jgi:uncharacterized protein YkwD